MQSAVIKGNRNVAIKYHRDASQDSRWIQTIDGNQEKSLSSQFEIYFSKSTSLRSNIKSIESFTSPSDIELFPKMFHVNDIVFKATYEP